MAALSRESGKLAAVGVALTATLLMTGYFLLVRRRKRQLSVGPEPTVFDQIERKLRERFPDASLVEVMDMGGSCEAPKIGVRVVAESLAGVGRVEQQRQCNAVIAPFLSAGLIHAVSYQISAGRPLKPKVNTGLEGSRSGGTTSSPEPRQGSPPSPGKGAQARESSGGTRSLGRQGSSSAQGGSFPVA